MGGQRAGAKRARGGGGIFKTAALAVLQGEQRLMTTGEITRVALDKALITCQGRTPEATMASALYTDVKRKLDRSLFTRPQEGLFGLREWGPMEPQSAPSWTLPEAWEPELSPSCTTPASSIPQDLENRHPQEQCAANQLEPWLELGQVQAAHQLASCSSPERSSPIRTMHLMESPVPLLKAGRHGQPPPLANLVTGPEVEASFEGDCISNDPSLVVLGVGFGPRNKDSKKARTGLDQDQEQHPDRQADQAAGFSSASQPAVQSLLMQLQTLRPSLQPDHAEADDAMLRNETSSAWGLSQQAQHQPATLSAAWQAVAALQLPESLEELSLSPRRLMTLASLDRDHMLPLSPSRNRQGGPLPTLDDLMASEFLDTPRSVAWGLSGAAASSWTLPVAWLPSGCQDTSYATADAGQLEQAFSISPKAGPEGSADAISALTSLGPQLEIAPLSINKGPWDQE